MSENIENKNLTVQILEETLKQLGLDENFTHDVINKLKELIDSEAFDDYEQISKILEESEVNADEDN